MISAFLDESYSPGRLAGICVVGVFYKERERDRLKRQWRAVLKRSNIEYFHVKEQAHRRGQFEGKTRGESDKIYQNLLAIFRNHALGSRAICHVPDIYDLSKGPLASHYSPYTICAYISMSLLISKAERLGYKKIRFFIESGHENENELKREIECHMSEDALWSGVESYRFVGKTDTPLIQTADVLAYEYWKRISDLKNTEDGSEPRPMRKSLESIIIFDEKADNHSLAILHERWLKRLPDYRPHFRVRPT